MNILNELVELANKANVAGQGSPEMADFRVTANPDTILAIAEAFRAMEKRAGAAEAKLTELEKQKPVAWRYRTTNIYGEPNQGWTFSDSDSLMDLYQPLYAHPAPTADLAALVPEEMPTSYIYHGGSGAFNAGKESGWNACRAAILRKIEEAK